MEVRSAITPVETKLFFWQGLAKGVSQSSFKNFFNGCDSLLASDARGLLYECLRQLKVSCSFTEECEVLVCGYTCSSVVQAVNDNNMKPVYYDINPNTLEPSSLSIKTACTSKTRVVILQHLLGQVVDFISIINWLKARDIIVIEDCSQILRPRHFENVSYSSDFYIYSFGRGKVLPVGYGGAIVIKSDYISSQDFQFANPKNFLVTKRIITALLSSRLLYTIIFPFIDLLTRKKENIPIKCYKLSKYQKIFLKTYFSNLEYIREIRRRNIEQIININEFKRKPMIKNIEDAYRYPLLIDDPAFLTKSLLRYGVRRLYTTVHEKSSNEIGERKLEGSKMLANTLITLPTHSRISKKHYKLIFAGFDDME